MGMTKQYEERNRRAENASPDAPPRARPSTPALMDADDDDDYVLDLTRDWSDASADDRVVSARAWGADAAPTIAPSSSIDRADARDARARASADAPYALPLPRAGTSLLVGQAHKKELGTVVWRAAVILCEALRARALDADFWRSRSVLEIGAGCGVCGFYAAALGARAVTIADCGPHTMRNLERTLLAFREVAEPECRDAVVIRRHLWEEDTEILNARRMGETPRRVRHWSNIESDGDGSESIHPDATFDVVIGSDLLYFASQEESLLNAINLRLKPDGVCYIVQTMRSNNGEVFARFVAAARTIFELTVESVALPLDGFPAAKETPHALANDPYRFLTLRKL